MKITKITYYKFRIPGQRGNLSKKCKERAGIPLFSGVRVGSAACAICPMFLIRIGNFIICKGRGRIKNG